MIKNGPKEAKINNVVCIIICAIGLRDGFICINRWMNYLGFIAVDRKQFYPFISHLYVTQIMKKKRQENC
jgi:hypothetical protein